MNSSRDAPWQLRGKFRQFLPYHKVLPRQDRQRAIGPAFTHRIDLSASNPSFSTVAL